VLNFIFSVVLFFISTNYENRCEMFGQTIVACCRFKSCCATCCKTPSATSTVPQILQSVVTELLRDNLNLCSRHLALRYLQYVFSVSCSYTPSVCVLGTLLSDTSNLCFQHLVLTHLQPVFSAPCSQIPSICVFSILFLSSFERCFGHVCPR
jgi:hypothetical protein